MTTPTAAPATPDPGPDLPSYDHVIVAFSGGKDSLACLLHLLDQGVPRSKIELWHHDVDGAVTTESPGFMDWPITGDYCRKVAEAFGVPIYFSCKEGGFKREMWRDGDATAPIRFEDPAGWRQTGGKGPPGVRLKFPQVSPDLRVRWCSAYLKIDVGAAALRNQRRFEGKRTLFVTGERAEESGARAKYKTLEPHRAHLAKRHIDAWRPVHAWSEADVWEAIRRWGVNPHPAYHLGWGRVSCAACIFGSANQFASLRVVNPPQFDEVAAAERTTGLTIKRKGTLTQLADKGTPYAAITTDMAKLATGHEYTAPVMLKPEDWKLPAGAFGESTGPT
jgi:3'-phosphoadenosine 5'-phosphosulfate sulfotransferase (PAPS reductase)/FAD synthetase